MTEPSDETDEVLGLRFKALAERVEEPPTTGAYASTATRPGPNRRLYAWAGAAAAVLVVVAAVAVVADRDDSQAVTDTAGQTPQQGKATPADPNGGTSPAASLSVSTPDTAIEDLNLILESLSTTTGAQFEQGAASSAAQAHETDAAETCEGLLKSARANGDLQSGEADDCEQTMYVLSVDGRTANGSPIQVSVAVFSDPSEVPGWEADRPAVFPEAQPVEGYGQKGISSVWSQEISLGDGTTGTRIEIHGPRGVATLTVNSAQGEESGALASAGAVLDAISQKRTG